VPEPGRLLTMKVYELLGSDLAAARVLQSLLFAAAAAICFMTLFKSARLVALPTLALCAAHLFVNAIGSVALLQFGLAALLLWACIATALPVFGSRQPASAARLVVAGALGLAAAAIFPFLALLALASAPLLKSFLSSSHGRSPSPPLSLPLPLPLPSPSPSPSPVNSPSMFNRKALLGTWLAALLLPPFLFLLFHLDLATVEGLLFGVSDGLRNPFLGLGGNTLSELITSAPRNLADSALFLVSAWGAPVSLLAPQLNVQTSWMNPLSLGLGAFLLLHPVLSLFDQIGNRKSEIANLLLLSLLLALSFSVAFPRSQALLGFAAIFYLPFAASAMLAAADAAQRLLSLAGNRVPFLARIPIPVALSVLALILAADLAWGFAFSG